MKAPTLTATATTAILLAGLTSGVAYAKPGSPAEIRGYNACLAANETSYRGLVPAKDYLLQETDTLRTYYINATAWKDGDRVDVALSCDTSLSGRMLTNRGGSYTHYVPASDPVQIAGQ